LNVSVSWAAYAKPHRLAMNETIVGLTE
jgi:hypothetical protein